MQIGLLGKANVGKSTFFSAATQTSVPMGNFPFTTIKPNVGVAHVRRACACMHFGSQLCGNCENGTRLIPIGLIDVAGLVPGAHEGRGLGNKFLDDARQADALVHVVDISGSTDIEGQPVAIGSHDPLKDIEFVHNEFDAWFTQLLEREWHKLTKETEQKKITLLDAVANRLSGLGIKLADVKDALQSENRTDIKPSCWQSADIASFASALRRHSKPIVIAANKADACLDLEILSKIKETIVPCSAEVELLLCKADKSGLAKYNPGSENFVETKGANEAQKKALAKAKTVIEKINGTGIQKILEIIVFDELKLLTVYPVEDETKLQNKDGSTLPDVKLLPLGSTAKDLARTIHADLADGFLHAINCKSKQRIGADYEIKDGDVIKIVSTKGRG
ncbi:MAG: translation-associated GTPase [Cenarchaeum symbiont of Oopsacas minuta]|nr:translation-associated GTPase [Cenarchaeum symbiont of Oopsacas minuta]